MKLQDQQTRYGLERLVRLITAHEHASELNPAQWAALRYLARANRYSDSPLAVARYLNATKGTVSQTIIALERKGYIEKQPREDENRSIRVKLTDAGREVLKQDPWLHLEKSLQALKPKQAKNFDKSIAQLLRREVKKHSTTSFGQCATCRFFRENGADSKSVGPHKCLLFDTPLKKRDARMICIEHQLG